MHFCPHNDCDYRGWLGLGNLRANGHPMTEVLAPGYASLFLTDGLKDYATALLTHFGHWIQPARRQDKGPMPKPRWMPRPELFYAQVVKSYRRWRIVGVKHRRESARVMIVGESRQGVLDSGRRRLCEALTS